MFTIDEFPGREIKIEGKNYLYFGGTSYLGLQIDANFQSLFVKNIKKYGTAYGASRKSNIRISIFDECETYLSKLVGSESCITMSSGYLAGQLICDYFDQTDYTLYYAPNTHSALLRGQQKTYKDWKELKNDFIKDQSENQVICLDSIDFKGNNYPDFKELRELPLEKITLIVDDSHGIGITGINGGGSYRFLKSLQSKELLVSSSLGKGFGIQAGAVFGSEPLIQKLKETQFYGGSSPASPASLATLIEAHDITLEKRKKLNHNTALFLSNLSNPSQFSFNQKHPTFSFQNEQFANYLEKNGIIVTNFRYPTLDDSIMSRIVISASHTNEDILKLTEIIDSSQKKTTLS